jgi:3-methyladenine DNA glycosylase/8-oxoguanine DNA glycosylase
MEIAIPVTRDFNFRRTVRSHGWCELLPFAFDEATWTLTRVLDLADTAPVTLKIKGMARAIKVNTSRRLSRKHQAEVVRNLRHMLRLDDEIGIFYKLVANDTEFAWIPTQGAGRLLRSPTVFEDLVKMICTTNCSWALTEKMVTGLVNYLGREGPDGQRTFPTPQAMALMPLKFYRDEIRTGYRAAYFKELADRTASGSLNVEKWRESDLPTDILKKEIKGVKGVGDYAAENLLKLLGRYDGLALDSWTRAKFAVVRNQGRAANDKKIARFYSRFDSWRGLALWCDLTRDWMEEPT